MYNSHQEQDYFGKSEFFTIRDKQEDEEEEGEEDEEKKQKIEDPFFDCDHAEEKYDVRSTSGNVSNNRSRTFGIIEQRNRTLNSEWKHSLQGHPVEKEEDISRLLAVINYVLCRVSDIPEMHLSSRNDSTCSHSKYFIFLYYIKVFKIPLDSITNASLLLQNLSLYAKGCEFFSQPKGIPIFSKVLLTFHEVITDLADNRPGPMTMNFSHTTSEEDFANFLKSSFEEFVKIWNCSEFDNFCYLFATKIIRKNPPEYPNDRNRKTARLSNATRVTREMCE